MSRIGIPDHGINLDENDARVVNIVDTGQAYIQLTESGTPENPVLYRGPNNYVPKKIVIDGSRYPLSNVIISGVHATKIEAIGQMNNIICRDNIFGGRDNVSGGGSVFKGLPSRLATNILIQNCAFHNGGDWQANYDQDINGLRIGDYSNNVHVYDCTAYHNSGDGFSVYGSNENLRNVFLNGNQAYENKQTGFWSKQASRVVFSQNKSYNHSPVGEHPSAYGAGMGFQYGPEDIWFLCNEIFNCNFGIQSQSVSGMGNGQNCYILGNKINNIKASRFDTNGVWGNAGITLASPANKHIYHNILHNCFRGINIVAAQKLDILGNVFNRILNQVINIEETPDPTIENNVSWIKPFLQYNRKSYDGWRELKLQEGVGLFNRVVEPDFNAPDDGYFRSTNLDAVWTRYGIYDIYREQYGKDIFLDVMGYLNS